MMTDQIKDKVAGDRAESLHLELQAGSRANGNGAETNL